MKTKDKKLIFNLPIDENSAILAYELPEYDAIYDGAELWVKVGRHKYKVARRNFVDYFGEEAYVRVHNIYEVDCEPAEFANKLMVQNNSLTENDNVLPELWWKTIFYYDQITSVRDRALFVYKSFKEYVIIFAEIKYRQANSLSGMDSVDVIKSAKISDKVFDEWKIVVSNEFEKRLVEDTKRYHGNTFTKEEWKVIFRNYREELA